MSGFTQERGRQVLPEKRAMNRACQGGICQRETNTGQWLKRKNSFYSGLLQREETSV